MTKEAPELPSSHKDTKCTAAHREIPSKRNPETSLVTPAWRVNERVPTLRLVGKVEAHSLHKPHPSTAPYNQDKTTQLPVSP